MSGVELKPCGLSAGSNILVPLGTTTIGRGPFLSIADKRVSRNHAILEIDHGVFRVKPIHVNPTFFAEKAESKLKPLKRDEWKKLENGNRVSLTPSEHIFEVVVEDRPVQASLTQSPRSSLGVPSPVKQPNEESPTRPISSEKDEEKAPSPACRKLDFDPGENNGSTGEEETNGQPEEGREQDEGGTSKDEDEGEDSKPARSDNKEYAKPVDRKRELPAWMTNLSSSSTQKETPAAAKPKATPKTTSRAKKRGTDEIEEEEEEEEVTKPPAKKRAPPASKNLRKAAPKYEEDSEEDEAPPPELKKKTSSRGRPTRRVSYADGMGDDDDDYDAAKDGVYEESDNDNGDEGSDWESENTPTKKGRKGKGKNTGGAKGRKGRKGRRSYSDESSEDDVYIPKPTKRTAKKLSSSQRSSDEEEASPPRKRRRDTKKRRDEDDDSEENDKERGRCTYGAKCFRKNPAHLRDFCHPGDDDYVEEEEEDEEVLDEKDKPECPYGAECYRKNADHRKQFKHSTTTNRPKRQSRQGRKKAADGDDDAPDTYDHEDSFPDDEEEETSKGRKSDDSDWDPAAGGSSEDVGQLVKDAKKYVKNKKMQKPV